jgi:hypothetical protein
MDLTLKDTKQPEAPPRIMSDLEAVDSSSAPQEPQEYSYFADLELAEDANLYRVGGLHPVLLGDAWTAVSK